MATHRKRLSDFGESIIPTIDLSNNKSFDSSFAQETEELLKQPDKKFYFNVQGQLDQKIANIDNLISIVQNNLKESERFSSKPTRLPKKSRLYNRAMLGFMLPIKNIQNV